jgi:hypothetical protein
MAQVSIDPRALSRTVYYASRPLPHSKLEAEVSDYSQNVICNLSRLCMHFYEAKPV